MLCKMLRLLLPMRRGATALNKQSTRSLMRAIRIHEFGGPDVLQVNEIPEPVEEDNEVLVEVKAAGINPVDTYIRQGGFQILPPLPAILGKEVAGVVKRTGSNVKKFKTGDRVFCCMPRDGGYAELITCTEDLTFPLSDKLSFSQGSGLYVAYFTAYRAIFTKCTVQKDDIVLVHGASGAVGVAAVQILKKLGALVIGTAGSTAGREVALIAGADSVFNHREKDYLREAVKTTDGRGFNLIIENAAHHNLGRDLRVLAKRGRVAIVGSKGDVKVTPRDLMYTEGSVTGVRLVADSPEEINKTAALLLEGANNGWISPIIEKEFHFHQAAEAHRLFFSRRARGKLVFVVD